MFSTLLMGGGGHTREKDHQNVKSLIIFAHDCRSQSRTTSTFFLALASERLGLGWNTDSKNKEA